MDSHVLSVAVSSRKQMVHPGVSPVFVENSVFFPLEYSYS